MGHIGVWVTRWYKFITHSDWLTPGLICKLGECIAYWEAEAVPDKLLAGSSISTPIVIGSDDSHIEAPEYLMNTSIRKDWQPDPEQDTYSPARGNFLSAAVWQQFPLDMPLIRPYLCEGPNDKYEE